MRPLGSSMVTNHILQTPWNVTHHGQPKWGGSIFRNFRNALNFPLTCALRLYMVCSSPPPAKLDSVGNRSGE